MKLLWFHLMPYTELPDDFREKNPSVWVDIDSSLFDPRRAHHMYNDFMDELEFASQCGFDGVCVNEHHSNGYGLMPSPNLIASTLARRTRDTAICVMGNSLALYQPPDPGGGRVRDARLHLGRAPHRGLPGGLPDGHLLRLRTEPEHAPLPLPRGARPRHAGLDDPRAVRVQRAFQPAALRQHLAAADPGPPSAHLDPGRRVGRDLAVVRQDGLRLFVPVVLRLQGGPPHRARVLAGDGPPRQGPQPVSGGLPPVRRGSRDRAARRRSSTERRPSTFTGAACTWTRGSRLRPATPRRRPCARGSSPRS